MKKIFVFTLALIFIISFVSSDGLQILNNNQIMTKTVGVNQNFIITLKNNFSQSFFNISIENNDYISFSPFSQLLSGDSVNITATVKKDDYNKNLLLNIYGLFLNTVGIRNETHMIDIDWDSQSKCDITLIEGDKINFTNTDQYSINLLLNYGEVTIPAQTSHIVDYNQVGNDFWFRRKVGALQLERCTVTVNSATGYVNDPSKNAKLNFTLNSVYDPTDRKSVV
jgi:hypothetical protein